MTNKWSPANADDLIKRYLAGEQGSLLAHESGVSHTTFYAFMKRHGITRPRRVPREMPQRPVTAEQIRSLLDKGLTVNAIANRIGVSRTVIYNRCRHAGIATPDASEGNRRQAAMASPYARKRRAQAAHDAMRGRKCSFDELCERARRYENDLRFASANEMMLAELLRARGMAFRQQAAIGPYNCDFAIGRVAVEVYGGEWHFSGRHLARAQKRINYIADAGFHVLVIVIGDRFPWSADTTDQIIAFCEAANGNPSMPRQYRMIGGCGELLAAERADGHNLTLVPPFTNTRDESSGRYKRVRR